TPCWRTAAPVALRIAATVALGSRQPPSHMGGCTNLPPLEDDHAHPTRALPAAARREPHAARADRAASAAAGTRPRHARPRRPATADLPRRLDPPAALPGRCAPARHARGTTGRAALP